MKDIFYKVFDTNKTISGDLETLHQAIKFARMNHGQTIKEFRRNFETSGAEKDSIDLGVVWTKKPESYWKSTLTGHVYAFEEGFVPQYDGWEPVHEETFIEYCMKMNIWR
jgi:hypothetical protein